MRKKFFFALVVLVIYLFVVHNVVDGAKAASGCSGSLSADVEKHLEKLGIDRCVEVEVGDTVKSYLLNEKLLREKNLVVYGTPEDVNADLKAQGKGGNDKKGSQWRFLGYVGGSGALYPDVDFPEDASGENHISKRNLIKEPWSKAGTTIKTDFQPIQHKDWQIKYSRKEVAQQLSRIVDKYYGTETNPAGDFKNLATDYGNFLYDYMVFSQFSEGFSPGLVTEWHKSYKTGAIYYDSFVIAPEKKPIGNLYIDPKSFKISNTQPNKPATITFTVGNTADYDVAGTHLAWKINEDGSATTIDVSLKAHSTQTVTVNVPSLPVDAKQFIANINYDKAEPPLEITWMDNRQVWPIVPVQAFKTPPLKFKEIDVTTATAYWDTVIVKHPSFDHFELTCPTAGGKMDMGSGSEKSLGGLQPATTYTCTLEAIDKTGGSGGKEKGSFTTLPLPVQDVGGGWKEKGLIREINKQRQSIDRVPATKPDLAKMDLSGDHVKKVANNYSPYFGELLGTYVQAEIKTYTYVWQFSYQVRVCETNDKGKRHCWYETRYANDRCTIEYPSVAPSSWTKNTSSPAGSKILAVASWNGGQANLMLESSYSKDCVGKHPKNPRPYQFTYHVPTKWKLDPSLRIDKGFIPRTNTIDKSYENLKITLNKIRQVKIGSDGRSISGASGSTTLGFKMLWSRYGVIATGN